MSQPSAVEPSADVRAGQEEVPSRLARQPATDAITELASTQIAAGSSLGSIASGVVLFACLLSWVAVGVSLMRGVPQAQATSA